MNCLRCKTVTRTEQVKDLGVAFETDNLYRLFGKDVKNLHVFLQDKLNMSFLKISIIRLKFEI